MSALKLLNTRFQKIVDAPSQTPCPRCAQSCNRQWIAQRCALDIWQGSQALLQIDIGVYSCSVCKNFFRYQPDYMRPRATFSNHAINIAVASVVEDKMPIRAVVRRVARDFGLKVSENAIRSWVSQAADAARAKITEHDTLPIVAEEFSGVLCVDEAYSGRLAVLFATDPNRKDQLIGYLVKDESFNQEDVVGFLKKLKDQGLEPDQVVTDESSLYPTVVKTIWPRVRHQLCLFHVSQKLSETAKTALREIRSLLPKKAAKSDRARRDSPEKVEAVFQLRAQGLGFKAIAEKIGVSKNSVKKWIRNPDFVQKRYGIDLGSGTVSSEPILTTKTITSCDLPQGWKSWKQVDEIQSHLSKMAFWITTKSVSEKRTEIYDFVLQSPVGPAVKEVREAIEAWQKIWIHEECDKSRAKRLWEEFKGLPIHSNYKSFGTFQKKLTDSLFEGLAHYFDNSSYESTNNSAERYARKFKKIQKSRYRIRSKTAVEDQLLLDSLSVRKPLQHGHLTKRNPLL